MGSLNREMAAAPKNYEDVLRGLRNMSGAMKNELTPAVQQADQATSGLSLSLGALSAMAGGVGVAIGHMASVLVGQLVDALRKSRDEAAAWQEAMSTANIDKITAAVARQSEEVTKLGRAFQYFPRDRRFGPVLQPLEEAIAQLGQGQLKKEYVTASNAYEQAEGPGVAAVTAQQEQQRIDQLKRDIADRARAARTSAEALQRFHFGVARRSGAADLAEYENTQRQSVLADQATYLAGGQAQEARLRAARPIGADASREYEDTIKQDELAMERKYNEQIRLEEKLFKERAKHYEQLKTYLEETDIFAGLEKGFKDMTRGAGEVMQDFARTASRGMMQSFDDLFFNAMTGQFKKMGDFGRQAGYALARSLSGALSELSVGGALKWGRGGFGGLISVATAGGGTMLVPGSAGAGAVDALSLGGGGTGAVAATPGGGGILDLLVGGIGAGGTSLAQYLGFAGAGVGLSADVFAGGAAAGAAGVDALSLGGNAGIASTAGTLGSLAGPVLAGVGFLASLYGAYQTRSPAMGAVTGGVSGLVAGATIGSVFPGYGTLIGGVVGLIAGAALGAGAGALGGGKGRRQYGSERRSADNVSAAVQGFSSTLNQAQTGVALLDILNRVWAPHSEFLIRATASDGTARQRNFTYADLFDPAILTSLTVYAGVSGSATPSFELTEALKSKLSQIVQIEGGLSVGYRETGPGVTRTTYSAFGALMRSPVPGQAFFFSSEAARSTGAPDASIAAVIREIARVNNQQDIIQDLTERQYLQL